MKRGKWACTWIRAEVSSLTGISRFVQDWFSRREGCLESQKERYLVELAVIEACTNIIRYAYPPSCPGRLGICLKGEGERIEILLLDRGTPFDPAGIRPPDLPKLKEGGYGIFLIHKIMDSVTYRRRCARWNCLHLVREMSGGKGGRPAGEGLEGLRRRIVDGKEEV